MREPHLPHWLRIEAKSWPCSSRTTREASRRARDDQSRWLTRTHLLIVPAQGQFPVEQEKRLALVADHPQRLHDVSGVLLLLNLLRHEPLQKSLARVIVLFGRQPVEVVYHGRDLLLVFERPLEDLQGRVELDDRPFYRPQHNATVTLQDKVIELHRVFRFLPRLCSHPVRETRKVSRLAVRRHREVLVGGVELVLDLFVHRILDRLIEHEYPLLGVVIRLYPLL